MASSWLSSAGAYISPPLLQSNPEKMANVNKKVGYHPVGVSSRNVPLSKRPTVKTFHSQNVPTQNVPFLKQNVPVGQNVPKSKRTNVNDLMQWLYSVTDCAVVINTDRDSKFKKFFNVREITIFTRHNWLSTGCQTDCTNRLDNRLEACLHDAAGCPTGCTIEQPVVTCTTCVTTGLTTAGFIV